MKHHVARAGLFVAFGIVAAACSAAPGGGSPPSRAPGPPSTTSPAPGVSAVATPAAPQVGQQIDACSLLTDSDIQAVTERSIASMDEGAVMGIFDNGCSWELDPGRDDVVGWSIELGVLSPGGRSYFDTFLSFPEDTEPVSGLGDVAVSSDVGGIHAVKGDTLVSVFVIAFSANDEFALTRDLVQAALSQVP